MPKTLTRLIVGAAVAISLSHCAVKTYPRPVTAKEKVQTNVHHEVDNVMAVLHHYLLGPGFGYDVSRQMVQVKNYEFYADPAFHTAANFYQAPPSLPAVKKELIEENDVRSVWLLSWPSLYQPLNPEFAPLYESYVEDHTAYGLYYQAKQPSRGAVVISHGWTNGDIRKLAAVHKMDDYLALGYDSVLMQQPYHGLRRPPGSKFSGEYFMSGEVSRLNESVAQAVMDVRSMAAWLRQDHAVVGIRGGSLGGYVTLATAVAEPRLDFAVAWVPPSSLADFPETSMLIPYIVKGMKKSGLDRDIARRVLYVSSPANYPPAMAKEDILIIAGMGDSFVPPDQPAKVWESWGHPEIFWYPGGHMFNPDLKEAWQLEKDFLQERLK